MALSIIKTHGSLNDIFVIDGAPGDHFAEADVARAVRRMCDRRQGLGGDGVYFVADHGDGTAEAYFYNPDGSPSLLCGNGMRGAGRLLLDRHQAEQVVLHTGPYFFTVRAADTTSHGVRQVSVELPPVDFTPAEPIVAEAAWPFVDQELPAYHASRHVSALAVPNSHLVTVLDDAYNEAELVATGTRVANTPGVFPIGANVSFVRPLDGMDASGGTGAAAGHASAATRDRDPEVFIRTFERGAGLTPSCGSGVAASRAVLSRLGRVDPDRPVIVRNPGGVARSWMQTGGERWLPVLEGNATKVYAAELEPAVLLGDGAIEYQGEAFLDEAQAFAALNSDNLKVLKEAGIEMTMKGPAAP